MVKRYAGGVISATALGVTVSSASGFFNTSTQLQYKQSGKWPLPTIQVKLLIVGGGGGGGTNWGGGGGAGGYRYFSNLTLYTTDTYVITVGAGGAYTVKGSDSSIASAVHSYVATGGGYGGQNAPAHTTGGIGPGLDGGSGGSGGGAGYDGTGGTGIAGSGNTPATSPSQGNNGGGPYALNTQPQGGGGGGAGAVGTTGASNKAGDGGVGVANPITGSTIGQLVTSTYYLAGGGGGGGYGTSSSFVGVGGNGGGGTGAYNNAGSSNGSPGTANTGGGGGGGSTNGGLGGTGGSGVVIIQYADTLPAAASTTGSPTITVSGGFRTYSFINTSGSIIF